MLRERALKERAPTRKGIPGLRAWLARHVAVLVPLLREPPPRWQAAPKDWIPAAIPAYQAEVVIGGQAAKTTRMTTVYHRGQPLRVTAAMQETMEVEEWVPELRVCHQPPGTLPSDTRLHRLLVALPGIQVQVDVPLHARLWRPPPSIPGPAAAHRGLGTHHRVSGCPPDGRLLAMGQDVASPSRDGHRGAAASPLDSHSPSGSGSFQVPGGMCGAQVPGAPE